MSIVIKCILLVGRKYLITLRKAIIALFKLNFDFHPFMYTHVACLVVCLCVILFVCFYGFLNKKVFRTLSNIQEWAFCKKNNWRLFTIFAKRSMLELWQVFKYASAEYKVIYLARFWYMFQHLKCIK